MTEAQNDTARIKRQVIFFLRFKGRQQPFFLAHTLVHDTLGCWNFNHEFRLHVLCQIHLSSAAQKPLRLNFLKFQLLF